MRLLALMLLVACGGEVGRIDLLDAADRSRDGLQLEEGTTYEVVLHAYDVPARDHAWKAAVSGAVRDDLGERVASFSGGPADYVSRTTDGNGRVYWSKLVLEEFTAPADGVYEFVVERRQITRPGGGARLDLVLREPSSFAGQGGGESLAFPLMVGGMVLLGAVGNRGWTGGRFLRRRRRNQLGYHGSCNGCGGGGGGGGSCGGCGS
jgi:hypothetical protein